MSRYLNVLCGFVLCALSLFISCHSKTVPAEENVAVDTSAVVQADTIMPQGDALLLQTAYFLSGREVPENSPLYKVTQQTVWKNYAAQVNNLWGAFQKKREQYVSWAETEIYPLSKEYKVLFSPFSGSDFLYADIFFPNIEKMYLFGLESVGSIPSVDSIYSKNLKKYLDTLNVGTGDILKYSFFITRHMKTELSNMQMDGVAPLLLIFLTQCNKEILSMQYGSIDNDGNFFVVPYGELKNHRNKLIEITYHKPGETKVRYLYYTGGTNVINGSLNINKEYVKFLNNMEDGCATFIKSASYLMHEDDFSMMKDIVLAKSDFIMQDDSGIPYRFFDKNEWKTQLYGSYTKPISLFSEYEEPDLAAAYKSENVKKLPFRIGYHRNSNERVHIKIKK